MTRDLGSQRGRFATLDELVEWIRRAPAGTQFGPDAVLEMLEPIAGDTAAPRVDTGPAPVASWRERVWTVPPDTRLNVAEVAEAIGRPKSYVYKHTQRRAADPLPACKLDGVLTVTAGELRAWLKATEERIHSARTPAALEFPARHGHHRGAAAPSDNRKS